MSALRPRPEAAALLNRADWLQKNRRIMTPAEMARMLKVPVATVNAALLRHHVTMNVCTSAVA